MTITIDTTPVAYQELFIREGEAPFLMSRVTTKNGVKIVTTDISTIKATIINVLTGATILNESTLVEATVWFDTYQTSADWTESTGDTTGYNFGWQTLATYFTTTTTHEPGQFKVEVWITPELGQPFQAGWWKITTIPSIVPIPA